MRSEPARIAAVALPLTVALALAAAGCGSSGGEAGTPASITLPSSLDVPTTASGGSLPDAATTVEVPPTNPAAEGAPVITSLRAEPTDPSCSGNVSPVTVTFTVEPQPPVRVFTVVLDGVKAGAANAADPMTVGPLPCDGAVHSVLFIATGFNAQSSTQAVAVRAPELP